MQAAKILVLPKDVDAKALRNAGYSLNDLLLARERLPHLHIHPPVTNRTLFDSQLKAAGYSATEFRDAGFKAEFLSLEYFWQIPPGEVDLTPGEKDWEECCAFFGATELRTANYTASELQHACFSIEDLQEAGFSECELQLTIV